MEYYDALGIDKSANADAIKKAYRKAAMKFHPDKNPGNKQAEEKFKLINEAYSVLSDPNKKSIYDQHGKEGLGSRGHTSHGNPHDIFNDVFSNFGGFGDFFNQHQKRSSAPQRGSNIQIRISVGIKDLVFGGDITVLIPTKHVCSDCSGRGSAGPLQICPGCAGQGKQTFMRGFMNLTTTCAQCHGAGKIIIDHCKPCHGTGSKKEQKEVAIGVPSGVRPGQMIRIPGEGNKDFGDVPGDLMVEVHSDTQGFDLHESNLIKKIDVDCIDACLGCKTNVDTLDGTKTVTIPKGIQHGQRIKLKELGFPRGVNSNLRGDLLLLVNIAIPTNLTDHQIGLLKNVRE